MMSKDGIEVFIGTKEKQELLASIGYGFRSTIKEMRYYRTVARAEPMTIGSFYKRNGWGEITDPDRKGFRVRYADYTQAWFPEEEFEKYFEDITQP